VEGLVSTYTNKPISSSTQTSFSSTFDCCSHEFCILKSFQLAEEKDRFLFLHHFTDLAVISVKLLKEGLSLLLGAWDVSSSISKDALKGGPWGLLGMYNCLFSNFLDHYNQSAADFKKKLDILSSIAVSLRNRIKAEALQVCFKITLR
jgi:hypothetical protein